ncbi:MAG: class I tRNA ligase family protein, partial [Nanoarchaeota archaeon]
QRYWGTPIPIVYCSKCGIQPVPEKELPVLLPEKVKFGEGNPLGTNETFLKAKCPKCKGSARRETDTMDTFFDSSWYFLRYCDALNKKEPFDKKKVSYWMPVDQYIGGAEHACMHLIYARFFVKALRDMGYLKFDEPFIKLFNQGMIHGEDGFVMSKSRGNVVDPTEMMEKYGADTLRLFLVLIASPDKDFAWNFTGIDSAHKFVSKVCDYFENVKVGKSTEKTESKLNKTIMDVTKDVESFNYNIGIIKLRQLFEKLSKEESRETLGNFLKMFSLFCPHLSEELWEKIGNKNVISSEKWPVANPKKINEKFEKEEQYIEKVKEDIINIKKIVGKEPRGLYIYSIPPEKKLLEENREVFEKLLGVKTEIYAVNDKSVNDPEGKAKKAKPGRPAILVQ